MIPAVLTDASYLPQALKANVKIASTRPWPSLPKPFPNHYSRINLPFKATEVLTAPLNIPNQSHLGYKIDFTSPLSIHFVETKHKANGPTIILESLGSMPDHTKTI
jgi:hypothetical protein